MIPTFIDIGGPWKVLPPGEHDACLYEVKKCFAINDCRIKLYAGIKRGCEVLKFAGCSIVFLDGSYITNKSTPGDFDLCWDPKGVNPVKLDPVLLDFSDNRKKQKLQYGGEFFPSSARADGSYTFVQFFRMDKYTGKEKGIVRILLH